MQETNPILEVHNDFTYLKHLPSQFLTKVKTCLSVETSGLVPIKKGGKVEMEYRESYWCALEKVSTKEYKFPTGLFHRFPFSIVPVTFHDYRENRIDPTSRPEQVLDQLGIEARPYQIKAVETLHKHSRGVMNIATNGGKTEIIAMILLTYPKCCSFIVASELTGLMEISERFDLRGLEHNIIDSKHKKLDLDGINVCSLSSVKNLPNFDELLASAKILVWDECDDSATAKTGDYIGRYSKAYVRVYLSGTPFTDKALHNFKVVAYSGEEIVKVSNHFLIQNGYSAKPKVVIHSSSPEPVKNSVCTYFQARSRFIEKNEQFVSRLLDSIESVVDEGVVVIYENKKHGKLIKDYIEGNSEYKCFQIDGSSSVEKRSQAKDFLVSGRVQIILASSIWNRAIDFGYPKHWFFVAGMKASNRVKQRWGRSLRKKPDGVNVVYIHEWFIWGQKNLVNHSKLRYKLALKEKFEIVLADKFLQDYLPVK